MSPDSAAVFAQVIPMLFIATFLQYRRYQGSDLFTALLLICLPATAVSEVFLLRAVASEVDLPVGADFFVWVAVLFHLAVLSGSAIQDFVHNKREAGKDHDKE
jgi:hypothetical protein